MPRILFVSATAEEAAHLPADALVLVTGVGTMNTAVALATHLADLGPERPERIVNVGTAGALRDGLAGVYEIHEVLQHDFSDEFISEMIGHPIPNMRQLLPVTHLPAARLATGDAFIHDSVTRERLAERSDLVDMEGYAVARIGAAFDIPVTLLKQVSDRADESAYRTWSAAVDIGAQELARELVRLDWARSAAPPAVS